MYIYKLSLQDKEQWDGVKTSFLTPDEDGNLPTGSTYTNNGMAIREIGHVPYDAVVDEEGNVITEGGLHEDYAVDILTSAEIPQVEQYIISSKDSYYHCFSGVSAEVVQPIPTDSWLKANIQAYLTAQGVEWTTSMLKAELLALC
jgi:hypothetical protein